MATLRAALSFVIDVTADELRLIHRGLHILSASKNAVTSEEAEAAPRPGWLRCLSQIGITTWSRRSWCRDFRRRV